MLTKKQKILIAAVLAVCLLLGIGLGVVIGNHMDRKADEETVKVVSDVTAAPIESDGTVKTEEAAGTEEAGEVPETETGTEEIGTVTEEKEILTEESVTETGEAVTEGTGTTEDAGTPTPTPTAKPKNTATPTPTTAPKTAKTESGTPVSNHGQLSVKGVSLVDKNGKSYQLQGVSTHGLQWFPQYVTKATFKTLRDEWGVNCIRLAMYTYEGGYCDGADKTKLKKVVTDGVEYATELGMYVIIDWHVLNEQTPTKYQSEAVTFFTEMAKKYADYNNVIYEICNEPNSGTSWSTIKSYAETVIPVIRKYDKDAVIIVGTPTWSQDVDVVAKDPIKNQTNIMYALHFYAGTHKDDLRNKYKTAISAGLPIFVSEFGITDASGNGSCDTASANTWISLLNSNNTSYCIWNLANKNESSCLLKSSCTKVSGFTASDLSEEGTWYVNLLSGGINLPKTDTSANSGNSANSGSNSSNQDSNSSGSSEAPAAISYTGGGATISSNSTWTEDGKSCYSMNFSFDSDVTGKTVTVTFNNNVTCLDSWGGDVTTSGKTLTIKNTQTWFGMNLAGDGALTVKSVSIK